MDDVVKETTNTSSELLSKVDGMARDLKTIKIVFVLSVVAGVAVGLGVFASILSPETLWGPATFAGTFVLALVVWLGIRLSKV
jgi:hypothetical protein